MLSGVTNTSSSHDLKGQILANLKAMESDWFCQKYMGRKERVSSLLFIVFRQRMK